MKKNNEDTEWKKKGLMFHSYNEPVLLTHCGLDYDETWVLHAINDVVSYLVLIG